MQKLMQWSMGLNARTLFGLVVATGLGLIVAVVTLLYSSLAIVTDKTNEIDALRSVETVQAGIQTSIERMTAMIEDNTAWDDAEARLYAPRLNTEWLHATWGAVSADKYAYDGTYLLDENFRVLWGETSQGRHQGSDPAIFGHGFQSLLTRHTGLVESGEVAVSGLTRMNDGIAIVGIGLVRPTEGALSGHGDKRRYVVMTRHLSPAMLRDMSTTFRTEHIRLTESPSLSTPYLWLNGADGAKLGRLTWTPRQPGIEAAKAASPNIQTSAWLIGGVVLLFFSVTGYCLYKLSTSEKTARTFALTDNLSGLPNRRALFERLQQYGRLQGPVHKAVVFIDLDGFKDVNDIYGHATGDKLIMIVAAALKQYLPEGGVLARMGGDEFAMLLGGKEADAQCQTFAEQALAFLTKPIRIGERTVQIGASIGIASGDLKVRRSQELFRRADMAMYHSKSTGKARITWFDGELDAARLRKQAIETGIRNGLANNEFEVVYQPIVDARTETITAVEALVRWPRRPEGELFPDQFIPMAESSGLIHAMGLFVLRRACESLRGLPDLRLSVNISPAQFRDAEFETKVAGVLAETGFPAHRLELEVTEGYLIENPERAIAAVATLKALGVSIALDDFGTGYSSIGYLRRYNFDKLKIDKSLAGKVDLDPQAAALVAGTVNIANALGLAVTAEGVETEDHVRLLKLAGCHFLQGYYFSKPKPLSDLVPLLEAKAA